MKILAIVPARGNSKRLPGKNVRPLAGEPLIAWTIRQAAEIPQIARLVVSTDDPAIAEVARAAGAEVPWLRPPELATDDASIVDVCLHALDWHEEAHGRPDALLLLQPTSPFRRRASIEAGIALFEAHEGRPVTSVAPASCHPMWCFEVEGDRMRRVIPCPGGHPVSQQLPPAYMANGAVYLISPRDLRERRSFYLDDAVPLIMRDPEESIDIDTEWDWTLAEHIVARRGGGM